MNRKSGYMRWVVGLLWLGAWLTGASAAPYVQPVVTDAVQVDAARGVMERLIPGVSRNVELQIIPKENGLDVFELESQGSKIVVRGSTGVALCSGFNWYLKEFAHCHISWAGDQLNLPDPLPKVPAKIRQVSPNKYRVYLNYCDFSYSMPWWDDVRWQREIDWMALQGINMPLAVTGLEAVWQHTLRQFKMNDDEIRTFLASPAHIAWQWMTNLEGIGGPLAQSWIDSHVVLGRKILEQERALGMTPIQQGFTGYVPRKLKEKYPDARIDLGRGWAGKAILGCGQLDPIDPLFETMAAAFYKAQFELFGTSHFCGADPFHEGAPPQPGDEYLKKVGVKIFQTMQAADTKTTWVMQNWSIREPIARTVPAGRLLVLDLTGGRASRYKGYWGYEFVKGTLNNFGGRTAMHGDLVEMAKNPFAAERKKYSNCVGLGFFMEGIENNPVFYDLQCEMIWRNEPVDINTWLKGYAKRRYGAESEKANQAWTILLKTAYGPRTTTTEASSMLAARPALTVKKSGANRSFVVGYQNSELAKAWELLLEDADRLKGSPAYRYDVVDLGRQVLSEMARDHQIVWKKAFRAGDAKAFEASKAFFLGIFPDVDRLLGTRAEFLFGKWYANAVAWGTTPEEKKQNAYNASLLPTWWGHDEGQPHMLFDYAWREWNGMVGDYYGGRWTLFLNYLDECLKNGVGYDDSKVQDSWGRQAMDGNEIFKQMMVFEQSWIAKEKNYPSVPVGDSVAVARELLAKYRTVLQSTKSEVDPEWGAKQKVQEKMQ
jgi:alpha-N-acetylglucosaminidase